MCWCILNKPRIVNTLTQGFLRSEPNWKQSIQLAYLVARFLAIYENYKICTTTIGHSEIDVVVWVGTVAVVSMCFSMFKIFYYGLWNEDSGGIL